MKAKHAFSSRLGWGSLASAVGLLLAGGGAAQTPSDGSLEEITVTGTRIRVTDGMAEPVPVTTMTPEELKSFEPGSTIAEQLDALPQFFNSGTAQRGGPGLFGDGGGSYLDMRGLGRDRTLVLFDGLRVPPADKRGQVNGRSIGGLRRGRARRRDELRARPRLRGHQIQRRHGRQRFQQRRPELQRLVRGRFRDRRAAQHHWVDRDASRRRGQSQSRRPRPRLVSALGLRE
jgi:hypothetical protein